MEKSKVIVIGDGGAGIAAAKALAQMDAQVIPATPLSKEEELKTIDVNLQKAYEKLSEYDKIMLHRGYKTWKTNGKSEYVLVDNLPFRRKRGTNFTPKKKKRK